MIETIYIYNRMHSEDGQNPEKRMEHSVNDTPDDFYTLLATINFSMIDGEMSVTNVEYIKDGFTDTIILYILRGYLKISEDDERYQNTKNHLSTQIVTTQ